MSKLDAGRRALGMNEGHNPGESIDLGILPEAQILGRDSAFWKNGRRLSKHETCTAYGTSGKMHKMPIVREAVDSGVLAHRRHSDAIRQCNSAETIWREEMMLSHGMDVRSSSIYYRCCFRPMRFHQGNAPLVFDLTMDECEQILVDEVGMDDGHAVRKPWVHFKRGLLNQFSCKGARIGMRAEGRHFRVVHGTNARDKFAQMISMYFSV